MIARRVVFVTLLWSLPAWAQTTRPRVHDPSTIIQSDGTYWLFATGGGIRSWQSRDLRQWVPGPRVLEDVPAWTRKYLRDDRLWAPDIIRGRDGRYFLYYSASSWGKNTSAIGLISRSTLDPSQKEPWRDDGAVIASSAKDNFNAIDPAVTFDADGRLWMSFGSYWSGIKLIELDRQTGRRIASDSAIHALASHKQIEAPYIHRRGDKYYLFVNFGLCCRGVNSTYEVRVGRSVSLTGPYLDRDGKGMLQGGGTLVLGSSGTFIGPGHAGIFADDRGEWFSCHFYDATNDGRPALSVRPLHWSNDGWPIIGE